MKKMFIYGVVAMSFASCSIQKQTTNTSKTLGIYGAGVIQKPVLTNLKVNPQKVTTLYSGDGVQGIDYHKSQAIAKALLENKADVIIEPSYEIVTNGTSVKITLSGFTGTYENFRQLNSADTTLLVDAGINDYNKAENTTANFAAPNKKKKGSALLILALVLGISAGVGALTGTY